MKVGPIEYLTTRDLLRAAPRRETHPFASLLVAEMLLKAIVGMTDEAAIVTIVSDLLTDLLAVCRELSEDLTRRHPYLPSDPQEQEQIWQAATAELLEQWGYQDITARVRDWYAHHADEQGKPSLFAARFVFQSPARVQYVRTLADLLILLDDARQTAAGQQPETDTPQEEDDDAPRL